MQKQHFLFLLIASFALAQSPADSSYREDQIYASIGYPLLTDTPEGVAQNKLSHTLEQHIDYPDES